MATAQDWIEAAYARSSANDPGKTAQDPELIGVLNRLYQLLFGLAAAAAPSSYLSRATVTLAAGVGPLPGDVINIVRAQTAGGVKVNVIPIEDIDRLYHLAPVVFRQGASLVSRGNPGDPGPADALTLWLVAAPAAITALNSAISTLFPVRYHNLVILELAMYLSAKDEGRNPAEYAELKAARDDERRSFTILSGLSTTALQSPHLAHLMQRFDALTLGSGGAK